MLGFVYLFGLFCFFGWLSGLVLGLVWVGLFVCLLDCFQFMDIY